MIRVSVLMPVYNVAEHLPAALASLEPDLGDDVEVIAVDDGSTDASGEILDRWKRPRVQVIHQDNAGLVGALNAAAAAASGELLARMDGDDVNVAGRLAACRAALREFDAGVVSTWAEHFEGDRALVTYRYPWLPADVDRALFVDNPIIHGSVLMRRDVFAAAGGYEASGSEDGHLWDRVSDLAPIAIVPKVLYRHRITATAVSTVHGAKQAADYRAVLDRRWARRRPAVPTLAHAAKARRAYRTDGSLPMWRQHLRQLGRRCRAEGHLPAAAGMYALSVLRD